MIGFPLNGLECPVVREVVVVGQFVCLSVCQYVGQCGCLSVCQCVSHDAGLVQGNVLDRTHSLLYPHDTLKYTHFPRFHEADHVTSHQSGCFLCDT